MFAAAAGQWPVGLVPHRGGGAAAFSRCRAVLFLAGTASPGPLDRIGHQRMAGAVTGAGRGFPRRPGPGLVRACGAERGIRFRGLGPDVRPLLPPALQREVFHRIAPPVGRQCGGGSGCTHIFGPELFD